jgi:prevent-host-death family protein
MPSRKQTESSKKLAKLLSRNESNVVSAGDLRHNSAEVVSRVALGGERIVLTRNRKPVAAIIPMDDFKALPKVKRR